MENRPLVIKAIVLWHEHLLFVLQWWVRKTKLAGARIFLCRSIIGIGTRTAGPIGTKEAPFDEPEKRKKTMVTISRVTSGMWHVIRAILQNSAKKIAKTAD